MNKTERITFRATADLKNQIEQFAKLQSISAGQLICNLIELSLKDQVINSTKHIYKTEDGKQFSNMKEMCDKLHISSLTARKRVKNGVIKKITINTYQTQQYGDQLPTTRSSTTETNRL